MAITVFLLFAVPVSDTGTDFEIITDNENTEYEISVGVTNRTASDFSLLQHPYLWMKARKDIYNDFDEFGIIRMCECPNHYLLSNDLRHLTRIIYTWITLYDELIWDAINTYVLRCVSLRKSFIQFSRCDSCVTLRISEI